VEMDSIYQPRKALPLEVK